MGPATLANRESENDERSHGCELRGRRNVLQQGTPSQTNHVHVSEDGDQKQSEKMCAREYNSRDREDDMLL